MYATSALHIGVLGMLSHPFSMMLRMQGPGHEQLGKGHLFGH